jgi:hypothetical protein
LKGKVIKPYSYLRSKFRIYYGTYNLMKEGGKAAILIQELGQPPIKETKL